MAADCAQQTDLHLLLLRRRTRRRTRFSGERATSETAGKQKPGSHQLLNHLCLADWLGPVDTAALLTTRRRRVMRNENVFCFPRDEVLVRGVIIPYARKQL
jgi:hypothetical protein